MNPKEQILKFIQSAYKRKTESGPPGKTEKAEDTSAENDIIQELFDGMSTGTARIIIQREIGRAVSEEFNINTVENKGRYYVARIVGPDGSSIQRLLLDKQTGNVQMIGR